ncbi:MULTISPECIES: hypothetical protein [Clostridium]|nr:MULTISPECIES: hypothetical protein [Clostridium]
MGTYSGAASGAIAGGGVDADSSYAGRYVTGAVGLAVGNLLD